MRQILRGTIRKGWWLGQRFKVPVQFGGGRGGRWMGRFWRLGAPGWPWGVGKRGCRSRFRVRHCSGGRALSVSGCACPLHTRSSLSFSLFLFLCSRVSAHKVSSHVKFTTTAYRPCAWNERTFLDVAWRLRSRSCLVRVENYRDSIVEQVRTSTLDDIFSLSLSVADSPCFSDLSRTLPLEE